MVNMQAKEDADTYIIKIAFNVVPNYDNLIVLGENIDLMVALIGFYIFTNV